MLRPAQECHTSRHQISRPLLAGSLTLNGWLTSHALNFLDHGQLRHVWFWGPVAQVLLNCDDGWYFLQEVLYYTLLASHVVWSWAGDLTPGATCSRKKCRNCTLSRGEYYICMHLTVLWGTWNGASWPTRGRVRIPLRMLHRLPRRCANGCLFGSQ